MQANTYRRWRRVQRWGGILMTSSLLQIPFFGRCDFGEVNTSVTLDSRDLISSVVSAFLISPIEAAINDGIDFVFDRLEGDDDGEV